MADRGVHLGLSRGQRLRKRSAFLRVQERGRRRSGANLVVYALAHGCGNGPVLGRLGVTVSKRVGAAVVRNRVKRWLRESYRLCSVRPRATDLVVIAKPSTSTRGYRALAAELRQLLLSLEQP